MSTTAPRLQDLPIPHDTPDPRDRYGISWRFPSIPASFADRNRRFHPYPPNAVPSDLFTVAQNLCTVPGYRFIRRNDQRQMLMFCDGACSNNGDGVQARGGCGIILTCKDAATGISFPMGVNEVPHTTNRAELCTVYLALGLRYWPGEGFEKVVIATDSEYVVLGITERIQQWIEKGWKTEAGNTVENKDLWEGLLKKLRELENSGCHVQFWQIPKEWNEADECAMKAALENNATRSQNRSGELDALVWMGDLQ